MKPGFIFKYGDFYWIVNDNLKCTQWRPYYEQRNEAQKRRKEKTSEILERKTHGEERETHG